MAEIIWTNLALDDLRAVYDYVSQDSLKYADRLVDKILQRAEILEEHPQAGRKVPEFDTDNIRELIEGNYRIIYRLDSEDRVGIVRVHHSARLLKGL